jgi:hypothetical protein
MTDVAVCVASLMSNKFSPETMAHRQIGLMNDELERMWKEAGVP